jgi:hypothetical protein
VIRFPTSAASFFTISASSNSPFFIFTSISLNFAKATFSAALALLNSKFILKAFSEFKSFVSSSSIKSCFFAFGSGFNSWAFSTLL